jgi:hypothetical protein
MTQSIVAHWFGAKFAELHPLLQQLHLQGGKLRGNVEIVMTSGLGGWLGRRLAKKLGVPGAGRTHHLQVDISHHADGLHWDRTFDGVGQMRSTFLPLGQWPQGHWLEKTGPLTMCLTVDVQNGGWHWRCLRMQLWGIPLPVWLFPKSKAYKTVEDGQYRFYVGFTVPGLGTVLSYSGLLDADLA